ncbi:MAG: 3-dehydroquinate synthase [Lachnospiraceae bacterium]|nr:3-dehydroquinate synthase [Lachnospiraceae bacterium]
MEMNIQLAERTSRIYIERDCRLHLEKYISLDCKVMVITDEGVPKQYHEEVLKQCKNGYLFVAKQGEETKSLEVYEQILQKLLALDFSRKDLIIALGGGVIGDLSGFVAGTFKRGMRFASIPTTTLSQIDSSIGGKVAVNMGEVKNVVGTFYHPEAVLIDLNTLSTLPERHYNNGLVEAVKAGLIGDAELFELFEKTEHIENDLEEIIVRALRVKKNVVEQDEKEENLRKILNFGHTIGHAIESIYHLEGYYHGECVGIGMMMILEKEEIRERLRKVLCKLNVPLSADYDVEEVIHFIKKDKKANGKYVTVVQVDKVGEAKLLPIEIESLRGNKI